MLKNDDFMFLIQIMNTTFAQKKELLRNLNEKIINENKILKKDELVRYDQLFNNVNSVGDCALFLIWQIEKSYIKNDLDNNMTRKAIRIIDNMFEQLLVKFTIILKDEVDYSQENLIDDYVELTKEYNKNLKEKNNKLSN